MHTGGIPPPIPPTHPTRAQVMRIIYEKPQTKLEMKFLGAHSLIRKICQQKFEYFARTRFKFILFYVYNVYKHSGALCAGENSAT